MAEGDDENAEQMEIILAELDAGIFALVENLDCDTSEIAEKLDDALQNSFWKRRLAVKALPEQTNQVAMLHGRATYNWTRTSTHERKGFFSASIGTDSGLEIVSKADEFRKLLELATNAIKTGVIEDLGYRCCDLAERLFAIYPFRPKMPSNWDSATWKAILEAWITGKALFRVTDSTGIAFVQEALVFRLVWAVEAVRIVLSSMDNPEGYSNDDDDRTFVALCLTYGVPSVSSARLLESGMESRLLAVRLTQELNLSFTTREDMILWLLQNYENDPIEFSSGERQAWQNFVRRNDDSCDPWSRRTETYSFRVGKGVNLEPGSWLRLRPNAEGTAELYTPSFEWVGRIDSSFTPSKPLCGMTIDGNEIEVSSLAPPEIPDWLRAT